MGPTDDDDDKYEALILAMLRNRGNVAKAAAASGIPRSTAFRWVKLPAFKAAYRKARRQSLDEALTALQVEAVDAVTALKGEFGPDATGSPTVVSAARWFVALAIKADEIFSVHDELADLRANFGEMRSGMVPKVAPLVATAAPLERVTPMLDDDLAEAVSLRCLWMNLVGHDQTDIAASLKFNRPQSVAEEQYNLDLVQKLLKAEKRETTLADED